MVPQLAFTVLPEMILGSIRESGTRREEIVVAVLAKYTQECGELPNANERIGAQITVLTHRGKIIEQDGVLRKKD